jgi:ubiquinone/menaquinone biosynthesis C-methylase UbiE
MRAMLTERVREFAVCGALLVLCALGCGCDRLPPPPPQEQDEYVADIVAFTGATEREVRDRIANGPARMKTEWEAWEKQATMTPERIKQFYKQTENYLYDLGHWHLWDAHKHRSDVALVDDMRTKYKPKNILDFGGGVGFNALLLAHAGFDVTLADLDSSTLKFAQFRAQRHGIPLKLWRSDVEPAPPDIKYDAIIVLDVLEHLPADELRTAVDKLIRLKHAGTQIILNAPFGRTDEHPMHLDADTVTEQQVHRLQTELPTG